MNILINVGFVKINKCFLINRLESSSTLIGLFFFFFENQIRLLDLIIKILGIVAKKRHAWLASSTNLFNLINLILN